jgi:hypothetical protein
VRAGLPCAYDNFALQLRRRQHHFLLVPDSGMERSLSSSSWTFMAWIRPQQPEPLFHTPTHANHTQQSQVAPSGLCSNSSLPSSTVISEFGSWSLLVECGQVRVSLPGIELEESAAWPFLSPVLSHNPIPLASWSHLAVSLDAAPTNCSLVEGNCEALHLRVYLNSSLASAANYPIPFHPLHQSSNRSLLVGVHWLDPVVAAAINLPTDFGSIDSVHNSTLFPSFHGEIDEVKLWTRALEEEEVALAAFDRIAIQEFSDAHAAHTPHTSGIHRQLALYFPFNEGGGVHTGVNPTGQLLPSEQVSPYAWARFVLSGPLCYAASRCLGGSQPWSNAAAYPSFALTPCCSLCPPGTYSLDGGSRCLSCPIGRFQPLSNSTSCEPCPTGFTTEAVAATACQPIDAYMPRLPPYPLPISQTQLQAMKDGRQGERQPLTDEPNLLISPFSQNAPTPEWVRVRAECSPGSVRSRLRVEEPLSGWDPDRGGFFIDTMHLLFCEACAAGSFSTQPNATACDLCPPGSHSFMEGQSVCHACSSGRFSSSSGQLSCHLCPAGTYANGTGQAACHPCPFQTYSPEEGASICLECPLGSVAATAGGEANHVGASQCISCETEPMDASIAALCPVCPRNTTFDFNSRSCQSCSSLYWQPLESAKPWQICTPQPCLVDAYDSDPFNWTHVNSTCAGQLVQHGEACQLQCETGFSPRGPPLTCEFGQATPGNQTCQRTYTHKNKL